MRRFAAAILLAGCGSARAADLTDVIFYDEGLRVETRDERFAARLEWRIQYRLALPSDASVRTADDVPVESGPVFSARRARLKIGGHVGWAWLRYAFQFDLLGPRLRDGRLSLGKTNGPVDVWIGQSKALYGRERLASSGEQQFAERSLSNAFFIVDRQVGVQWQSQFAETARVGFALGVFAGNGVLEIGTDPYPMVVGRFQVHPFGVIEAPTESDLQFTPTPALTLTVGGAWTRGPYTAFTSEGAGQLPGFEAGGDDRYALAQGLLDVSAAWKGISAQAEADVKSVVDTEDDETTTLVGGYAQVGWLPHGVFPAVPPIWEVALRASWVDPALGVEDDAMTEVTAATNAYVNGHRMKATADLSLLVGGHDLGWRGRLQWDYSF